MSNDEAFGYIRSSDLDQGFCINLQEEEIKRFCTYKNVKLVKIYSDIGSSDESTAPQLNQMLDDLKPGMFVIVYDLQRLSRDTEKACSYYEMIKKKGGKLVCPK